MTDNSEAKTKLVMRNGKLVTVSIITRDEADKLNDFAQGLDDEITHVVDYGGVEEDTKKKKPKLPTKVVIIETDKQCTCGHDKEVIRYDVSHALTFNLKCMRSLKSAKKSLLVSSTVKVQRKQLKRLKGFYPKQV